MSFALQRRKDPDLALTPPEGWHRFARQTWQPPHAPTRTWRTTATTFALKRPGNGEPIPVRPPVNDVEVERIADACGELAEGSRMQ